MDELDVDAAVMRQAVGLVLAAIDLPLERIAFKALAMTAWIVLVLVGAAVAVVVPAHRRRARQVQETKRIPKLPVLPRHRLIKEIDRPRYPGMGTDEQRRLEERKLLAELRRADRADLLPGQDPWGT